MFAPVVDSTTVHTCLAITVSQFYQIHQMNVKMAFPYCQSDSKVWEGPPPGNGIELKHRQAIRFHLKLYGLKQYPKLWYTKWTEVINRLEYAPLIADICVFSRGDIWVLLYVDEIVIIGPHQEEIVKVKQELNLLLKFKELSLWSSLLGLSIVRKSNGIRLEQEAYATRIQIRFGMANYKPHYTPFLPSSASPHDPKDYHSEHTGFQGLVRCLLFFSTCRWPDISIATDILCRFVSSPSKLYWIAAKRIFLYLFARNGSPWTTDEREKYRRLNCFQ